MTFYPQNALSLLSLVSPFSLFLKKHFLVILRFSIHLCSRPLINYSIKIILKFFTNFLFLLFAYAI